MHEQIDLTKYVTATSGQVKTVTGHIQIGDLHAQRKCMQLAAKDDCITINLSGLSTGVEFVLELTELHSKADQPFAYEILIDGQLVAVRTMEPLSSTLYPYFVLVFMQDRKAKSLSLRNISGTTIRLSEIYLHTNPQAIRNIYLTPMEIGFCFPKLSFDNLEQDLHLLRKMQEDTSDLIHFTFAVGIEIKFMNLNDAELEERFKYVFRLAKEAALPLIFNFNSWWDGTPCCRDGNGGYLNDAEYQQVIYDPRKGAKSLSIPNIWRNTPWLTMNHPHLNSVRKIRLRSAMEILYRVGAHFCLENGSVPNYRLFIDNEPTYWSQYAYCQSPECGGDYNERCIADARANGVDMEPSGELATAQRLWLMKNLSAYMTDLTKEYHRCSTEEYSVMLDNQMAYGNHHLAENTFTHIFPHSGYPLADDRHPHYEEHVTRFARLGIEASGFQDDRLLAYAAATGRWAQVNAERCCYSDPLFHHQMYGHGAVCDIIFNFFYDQDIKHLHQLDKLEDAVYFEPQHGYPVMEYCTYTRKVSGGAIVAQENMEVAPLRERWVLRPAQLGRGSITFHVGSTAQYPHGGWLELIGLVRPMNGTVTLDAGYSVDALKPFAVLQDRDADYQRIPLRISLNDLLKKPSQELYIRLNMEMNYYDDWAQLNAVWNFRTVAAMNDHAISTAIPLPLFRALSSMVSVRQDCLRLMELFPEVKTPVILDALDKGDYANTYAQLMHDISVKYSKPVPELSKQSDEVHHCIVGTFLNYNEETQTLCYTTHDASVSRYQDHLHIHCSRDTWVSLHASEITGDMLAHISTNPYTPAAIVTARIDPMPTLHSLKRGDMITLTIEGKEIQRIDAVRGLARGKVVRIEPMSLSAPMHNGLITLETAPGKQYTFDVGMQTMLNYTSAPAQCAMLCGESMLGLELGSVVLISFESETRQGRPYRALDITVI